MGQGISKVIGGFKSTKVEATFAESAISASPSTPPAIPDKIKKMVARHLGAARRALAEMTKTGDDADITLIKDKNRHSSDLEKIAARFTKQAKEVEKAFETIFTLREDYDVNDALLEAYGYYLEAEAMKAMANVYLGIKQMGENKDIPRKQLDIAQRETPLDYGDGDEESARPKSAKEKESKNKSTAEAGPSSANPTLNEGSESTPLLKSDEANYESLSADSVHIEQASFAARMTAFNEALHARIKAVAGNKLSEEAFKTYQKAIKTSKNIGAVFSSNSPSAPAPEGEDQTPLEEFAYYNDMIVIARKVANATLSNAPDTAGAGTSALTITNSSIAGATQSAADLKKQWADLCERLQQHLPTDAVDALTLPSMEEMQKTLDQLYVDAQNQDSIYKLYKPFTRRAGLPGFILGLPNIRHGEERYRAMLYRVHALVNGLLGRFVIGQSVWSAAASGIAHMSVDVGQGLPSDNLLTLYDALYRTSFLLPLIEMGKQLAAEGGKEWFTTVKNYILLPQVMFGLVMIGSFLALMSVDRALSPKKGEKPEHYLPHTVAVYNYDNHNRQGRWIALLTVLSQILLTAGVTATFLLAPNSGDESSSSSQALGVVMSAGMAITLLVLGPYLLQLGIFLVCEPFIRCTNYYTKTVHHDAPTSTIVTKFGEKLPEKQVPTIDDDASAGNEASAAKNSKQPITDPKKGKAPIHAPF